MYSFVFSAGIYYIIKLINNGIAISTNDEQYYQHGIEASLLKAIPPKEV
jgi:hypothetical protein